MNRENIIKILVHPFFIGFVISCMIVGFMMPEISRYKIEIQEKTHHGSNVKLYFDDLDNNNTSEEINIDKSETLLKVMLFKGAQLIEQYNLRSMPISGEYYFAGDYNLDGFKELFFFTMHNDSILLSIIDPFKEEGFVVENRLIFYNDTVQYNLDWPQVSVAGLINFSGDRNQEIVFSITSGFSKRPRSVYCYDISSDSLITSPKSGATILSCCLEDLDGDSIPEVLITADATGNYHMDYPYRDHSSWMMVLNKGMEFKFSPIEFEGYPSRLVSTLFHTGDTVFIAALHEYYGPDNLKSGLYLFDVSGNLLRSKTMEFFERGNYFLTSGTSIRHSVLFLLNAKTNMVQELDKDLEVVKERKIPPLYKGLLIANLDVDADGWTEPIFWGEKFGSVVVFRKNFRHPLVIDFDEEQFPYHFSTLSRDGKNLLYLHYENYGYFVHYKPNPLFYAKYPIALAIYVSISFIILLIYRTQRYRAEKQYQTQQKISELQILSLKNQIDPHFTFNILNSIGHMYTNSDLKEKAYDIFVKYSRLLRHSVENSHKITVSLKEELEFIRNYIELEQFRSNNSFTYSIDVGEDVDQDITIPRQLIHTFVENSIKHGIRQRESDSGGELRIEVSRKSDHYEISIRDNGPGLNKSPETDAVGTGKGLQIIDELIELFYSLEGVRVSYSMKDDLVQQKIFGTKVVVTIPD